MSTPPLFEVYSVEDGDLFGILLKKQYIDGRIERAYFYLDSPEGLPLTREILHTNHIKEVKLAKREFHEKLLKELQAYARASKETGDISATRCLSQKYRGKEDFGVIITRIFDRGNEDLVDFLESSKTFKLRVLERIRSRNEVEGKARYFGVTSPDHVLPDERLQYLRPIRDVLEIYVQSFIEENGAQWFRKTGPIAADFKCEKYYRREEVLGRLESLVSNKPVSLLIGERATGKTVLVLNLAYELNRAKKRVYYFDCDRERDFSRSSLTSDIRSTTGIIIIENIHLAPQKFQSLCSDFKFDKDRHILLTSRPSLFDYLSSKSEDLSKLPKLRIRPFEDIDGLIDCFVSDQLTTPLSPEIREQIRDVSSDSFWLLAYALMGYTASNGHGKPKDWIEFGVTKDLQDLENIYPSYPEVLVVISTLYRVETLTAENYLTSHLGCGLDVLNALAREGEITRQQSSEGYVFYGLPHSALADAYWQFGQKYKWRMNISQYEDFLYDYASSGAPNGLEAIVKVTEKRLRRKAIALLADNDKLGDAIRNEQSIQIVARWLYTADTRVVVRDDVIASLVHRLEEYDSTEEVGGFLERMYNHGQKVWQKFYPQLNVEKLVERMTKMAGSTSVAMAACCLLKDEEAARKLYDLIDLKDLIAELNQSEDLYTIERPMLLIYRLDPKADRILSSAGFDWKKFADKLCATRDLMDVESCIKTIVSFDQRAAKRLCRLLTFDKLVQNLKRSFSVWSVADAIATIYWADRNTGRRLWNSLKQKLADGISQIEWPCDAQHCIWAISDNTSRSMGQELVSLLNLEQLAERLTRPTRYLRDGVNCARMVIRANREIGGKFWKLYSVKLAEVLNESEEGYRLVAPCIRNLIFEMPRKASELSKLLNIEKLAANLNSAPDLWDVVCECVWKMLKANKAVGRKLWRRIDKTKMKGGLFSDIWDGIGHLSNIHSLDPKIAKDLCRLLNIKELAKTLNQLDIISVGPCGAEISCYISLFFSVDPVLGQQFWQSLDKKHLANRLSSTENISDTSGFIEEIYDVDANIVKDFCNLLNCDELASILSAKGSTEEQDELIKVLAKANPSVHQKLLKFLNDQ